MVPPTPNAPKTHYSNLHNSITSLCKTILPVAFNKRCRLVSAEHKLCKLQSENQKWQQDTFHQLLNLMALHRDDILTEPEVSAFRNHLIRTVLASPDPQQDHPLILRDKLGFLQELLDAKCISEGEYHSSRRPLLQRLAAQGGGEIGGRDVMMVAGSQDAEQNSEEEWSVIDLKDEQCLMNKENSNSKKKTRKKNIKGAFSFGSSNKHGKNQKEKKSIFDSPSLQMNSAHSEVPSSTNETRHSKDNNPFWDGTEKLKRKPFRIMFHREKKEGHGGGDHVLEPEGIAGKSAKKQWGFEKWRRNDSDDETAPLSLLMENKLHLHSDVSPSEKVSEDKINKEVSIIQTELRSKNTNAKFSTDRMQAISTKLPENKIELKNHFPKYGGVLDVVKKEFKDHVGEKEYMHNDAEVKHESTMGWTTFEDDENLHPNLFAHRDNSLRSSSINPFSNGYAESK